MLIPGPFSGSRLSRTSLYTWLSGGLCCCFLVITVQYVRAEKAIDAANEGRLHAYLVADELRHSSDDLTRMVRSYVATSNPNFKQWYQEILEVRAGLSPRPLDPANVYWDLVLDEGIRPRGFGSRVAFVELSRRAGFSAEEIAKLTEAKTASDELTKTEFAAMAIVDALTPTPDGERLRAIRMLQDKEYRKAKARIMRPIAEFQALSSRRTLDRVRAAVRDADRRRWYAIAFGAGLLATYIRLLSSINAEKREKSASYRLFRDLFDQAGVGLARLTSSGRFEHVNQEFCRVLGYTPSRLLAGDFGLEQLLLPEDRPLLRTRLAGIVRGDLTELGLTLRCVHLSGRILWVNLSVHVVGQGDQQSPTLILTLFDTTASKEAAAELESHRAHLEHLVEERTLELETGNERLKREVLAREQAVEALQESEGRFRFIAENSADVIWTMDLQTWNLTYVSPSVGMLLGRTASDVVQKPLTANLTPESAKRLNDALQAAVERFNISDHSKATQLIEVDQLHNDGAIVHTEVVTTLHADDGMSPTSVLGVTRNITQRKVAEEAIRQLAFYDGLTKLPNRRLLLDRLKQAILRARRDGSRLAVLFIDLDRFKPVNDAYGHQIGDWLLCTVATRLQACLRDSDTAARMGGDEFVVLLPDLLHTDDALAVAERIRSSLEKPFVTETEEELQISSSTGVAIYPDHGSSEDELLRLGDEAMYQAKNLGRNQVTMLRPESRPPESRRISVSAVGSLIQLTWRPAYACGDTLIDGEHRELFNLANRLFQAAICSDQPDEILRLLDRGLSSIRQHFAHEEEILRDCGYPRLFEHLALHQSLLERAQMLRERLTKDTLTVGQLVDFVGVEVIARHMLLADREYFSFLGKRQSELADTSD